MRQLIMIFDFRDLYSVLEKPIYDAIEAFTQRDPLEFEIEMVLDEFMKTAFCRLHHQQPNLYPTSFYTDHYHCSELVQSMYGVMGPMVEQQLVHWMRGENAFPLDPRSRYKVLVTPETLIIVRLQSPWQTIMV